MDTLTALDPFREHPPARRRRGADRVIRSIRGIDAWHAARRRDRGGVAVLSAAEQRQHEVIVMATSQQLQQAGAPLDDPRCRTVVVVAPDDVAETLSSALARAGLAVVALCWDPASAVGFAVAEQPDFVLVAGDLPGSFTRDAAHEVARFSPDTTIVVLGASSDIDVAATRGVPDATCADAVARWMAQEMGA